MIWRDWYTHDVVNASISQNTTLSAPLGHIPVHIRDGSALLLHQSPAYTTTETRQGPFSLLVSLAADGYAFGTAYLDDGISYPPGPSTTLTIRTDVTSTHAATNAEGEVSVRPEGTFSITSKLEQVTILGVGHKPGEVIVNGKEIGGDGWEYLDAQQKLVVSNADADLNEGVTVSWK